MNALIAPILLPSMHPPTHCISEVPKLIGLIFRFMEKQHLVKLLTVSRCFFYFVAPLIWKDVSRTRKLLDVLPSMDVGVLQSLGPNVSHHDPDLAPELIVGHLSSTLNLVSGLSWLTSPYTPHLFRCLNHTPAWMLAIQAGRFCSRGCQLNLCCLIYEH